MGLDYDFYVQQRCEDGWIVPKGFTNRLGGYREDLGCFVWFTHAPLFIGDSAIFPLDTGPPPGIEDTLLFQRLAFHDWYFGWIAFDNLLVDDWEDSYVYKATHVPAHVADAFADGAQLFPAQPLADRSCSEDEIAAIRDDYTTHIVDRPILPEFSGGWVKVSWKLTIAEFLGDWRVLEFQKLRQFADDSDLRIICTYS